MNNEKYYVVHLLDDFSGSPKVLVSLLETLKQNNKKFDVFLGGDSKGFVASSFNDCKRYFYKRSEIKFFTLLSYLLSQIYLFLLLIYTFYADRKIQNKKVIVNTLLPFGASLAAKVMRVNVIYYIHETSIKPQLLKQFLLNIVQFTCKNVLFVSKFISDDLNLCVKNKHVIYNPLPLEYDSISLSQCVIRKKWEHKNVLMACSLKDYKGIPEFISISNKLKAHSFILVINDTEENANKYFSSYDIPSNLSILCRPKNIIALYLKAFLVLNLSDKDNWIETFGLTLIEAMSAYTPVICPMVGGPLEIVRDNIDGYHIDSKSEKVLLEAIQLLSDDYALWKQYSNSAKERSRKFSMVEYRTNLISML